MTELFALEDLQRLQDQFSLTTGTASIIVETSGAPITRASGFTRFCQMVRDTPAGLINCRHSDAVLGQMTEGEPIIHPCLSAGMLDAATAIRINGRPIAFWMIGQIRDDSQPESNIRQYARKIGADEEDLLTAFNEITPIRRERFEQDVQFLTLLADQLSTIAYQNYVLNRHREKDRKLLDELKRKESYLRTLINTMPDLFWMKDKEGRFLYCNPRVENFLGADSSEIIGKTDYDLVSREQAETFHQRDRHVLETREEVKNEIELTFASDGHREILETIKTPILQGNGEITGVLGIARDITAHKEAERERQEHIDFFRNLDRINQTIQKSTDLEEVLNNILDDVLSIFHCHRAYFVYPCDPDSPILRVPFSRHTPDVPDSDHTRRETPMSPFVTAAYRKMLETGRIYERYEPEKGNEGNWEKYKTRAIMQIILHPKMGKPWVFVLHHCLNERVWTEREKELFQEIGNRITDSLTNLLMYRDIQEKENFITNIFENIPSMIFVKEASELTYVRINKAGEELIGRKRDEIMRKRDEDIFPRDIADFFNSMDRKILKSKTLLDIPQERVETRDGEERILHTQKIPLLNSEGKPEYLLGLSEDITEKISAARELDEKRTWLQAFMESTSDAITIYDKNGYIVLINNRALELYPEGIVRDRVRSSNIADFKERYSESGREIIKYFDLVRETGRTYMFQRRHQSENREMHLSHKVFPVGEGIGFITTDITEQKTLEEQLQQIQKVESIGRLAGGVAHDFNNILGIIMGYTEMALNSRRKDAEHDSYLNEIMNAAERSADLTRQLLAFARKQNARPQQLDLNSTVEKMLKMLKSLIGEYIELSWKPDRDLWKTLMDPVQIDQILANLCVNARDAIDGTGSMTISTSNQVLDETYCAFHPDVSPGEYICLSVSDDGRGMDGVTLSQIFEPFFTTKSRGKGTGLGLSTVYGIVKQNQGSISVYSEPGIGTTFKVFFLRETGEKTEKAEQTEKAAAGGQEQILVIEDEEALMHMTARMLERYGYSVLTAGTKGEALRVAEEKGNELDLILSDIVMPEMNGKELIKIITADHPRIKYLFMSGYIDDIIASHGILEEGIRFIQKPFSSRELALTIRRILDTPES